MVGTSRSDPSRTGLSYDAQGRLQTATMPDGTGVVLAYNALGQRASYTVTPHGASQPSLVEAFTYRGGELAQVSYSGSSIPSAYTDTYLFGPGGVPYELLRQSGSTTSRYWYLLNGHDDVVALTDTTGNVVDRYHYDLWGVPSIDLETVKQPLLYAGYWYDRELHAPNVTTGWYWLSVRPYDPALKRFTQPDPSGFDGIRSYVYVGDDPVDGADPSGEQSEEGGIGLPIGDVGVGGDVGIGGTSGDTTTGSADLSADTAVAESGDKLVVSPVNRLEGTPSADAEFQVPGTTDTIKAGTLVGKYYGRLDRLRRATGVVARLTRTSIKGGTAATYTPKGYVMNEGLARGHLLGKQLGGSGQKYENLVPLYHNAANSPVMRGYENMVRARVEAGETIYYRVTPSYTGARLLPASVEIQAYGDKGFVLDVRLTNEPIPTVTRIR